MATQIAEDRTLIEMFRRVCVTYADRPALVFRDQAERVVWTYTELGRHADAFAGMLRQRGIGQGERVVIWAPNRPWWVATFIGCLLEGVVTVPLDVRGSPEFARDVVAMMEARLVIAGGDQASTFAGETVPVISIDDLTALVASASAARAERPAIGEDDLVEIVYTSGTTGHPRGVMISHRNLLSNIRSLPSHLRGDPSYRLLSVLPLSHLFEQTVGLWYALYCGASVIYPRSIQGSTIFEALSAEGITGMLVVPQVLSLFYHAIEREVQRAGRERAWRIMHRIAPHLPFGLRRYVFRSVHKRLGGAFKFFVSGGAGLPPGWGSPGRTWVLRWCRGMA